MAGIGGAFLAVAHHGQARGGHAQVGQVVGGGAGAALAQGQVVLGGATLVAVAFDDQLDLRVLLHDLGLAGQHLTGFGLQVVAVEVEVDHGAQLAGDATQLFAQLALTGQALALLFLPGVLVGAGDLLAAATGAQDGDAHKGQKSQNKPVFHENFLLSCGQRRGHPLPRYGVRKCIPPTGETHTLLHEKGKCGPVRSCSVLGRAVRYVFPRVSPLPPRVRTRASAPRPRRLGSGPRFRRCGWSSRACGRPRGWRKTR